MTNFSSGAGPARFTRERILTAVPLLMGSLVAAVLVVVLLRPTFQRSRVLADRLTQVRAQEQQLPAMRQRLKAANQELQTAQNQQAVLLDLLAGRDRIQTFLALLDQVAGVTGVEIVRFEPLRDRPDSTPQSKSSEASADPLEALGYQKTSIALQARGSYSGLQRFLQSMESLEIMVEGSDLELTSLQRVPSADKQSISPRTTLAVRLSFYDRRSRGARDRDRAPVVEPLG